MLLSRPASSAECLCAWLCSVLPLFWALSVVRVPGCVLSFEMTDGGLTAASQHSQHLPTFLPTSRQHLANTDSRHMADSGLRGPCAVKARGCSGREASRNTNSDHEWNWRGAKIAGSLKSSDRDFDGAETVWTRKGGKQPGNDVCKNGACIRLGCGPPVKAAAKAAASTEPLPHEPPAHEMVACIQRR